jgi:hypothetical protein
MIVNDLDKENNEDLNEMAIDFCQLSLNAMAGTKSSNSIKLQSIV